jgi:hypothetical protein
MSVVSLKQGLEDNFKDYESSSEFVGVITRLNNVAFAIDEFFGKGKVKIDIEPGNYGIMYFMIAYPSSVRHTIFKIEMTNNKYPLKLSSNSVSINFICNNIDELDSSLVHFFQNPHIKDLIYSIKTLLFWFVV